MCGKDATIFVGRLHDHGPGSVSEKNRYIPAAIRELEGHGMFLRTHDQYTLELAASYEVIRRAEGIDEPRALSAYIDCRYAGEPELLAEHTGTARKVIVRTKRGQDDAVDGSRVQAGLIQGSKRGLIGEFTTPHVIRRVPPSLDPGSLSDPLVARIH
jgi:hypothetical protein